MKKPLAISLLICLAAMLGQPAAFADHDWFNKWDRDHDGRWSKDDFRDAHWDWQKRHNQRLWKEEKVEQHFKRYDRDHDGYVRDEDVRKFHRWD